MNKLMKKRIVAALIALSVTAVAIPATTQAFGLGDIFKVAGVGVFVDSLATPLNNFINSLFAQKGAGSHYATKVVPIISAGNQGYIGAAQVTGSHALVGRTQAVLQIEGQFDSGGFRVKGLIPIDSKNPFNFSRVQGVGVSAVIDARI